MSTGPIQWTQSHGFVPAMTSAVGRGPLGSAVPQLSENDPDEDEGVEPEDPTNLPRRPAPPFAAMKKAPKSGAVSPKNIVATAKKRLRDIESELRRMKRLEKERDELRRLVEAATNKPRAVVREIKRSAG